MTRDKDERISELLVSNNELLDRARKAEAALSHYKREHTFLCQRVIDLAISNEEFAEELANTMLTHGEADRIDQDQEEIAEAISEMTPLGSVPMRRLEDQILENKQARERNSK